MTRARPFGCQAVLEGLHVQPEHIFFIKNRNCVTKTMPTGYFLSHK